MTIQKSLESTEQFPAWATYVWRMVRGAFATALAQSATIQVNWTEPNQALRALGTSFLAGFLMALGLAIRDTLSKGNKKSAVNKLPL